MLRQLLIFCVFCAGVHPLQAQIGAVRQIPMEKDASQSKLFLLYEDSLYRLLAPETAIRDVLKPLKENDRLPLAFRQLDNEHSTDYYQASIRRGLALESQFLIHELLERGGCLIERKPDRTKVKALVAMSYRDGLIEGIRYQVGDHTLYNYVVPLK